MRLFLMFALSAWIARADMVDRLVIAVGSTVVTELQLDEELRVTAFLNGEPITRNLQTRRAAADRLVQQILVKREMDLSHYPLPNESDVDQYFNTIQTQFGGPEKFEPLIKTYGLTLAALREHLALQLTTLRFIEYRFRPDVEISDAEIGERYQQLSTDWKREHQGAPPPLEHYMDAITKSLTQERIDGALNAWLEEARKGVNIVYLDRDLE